MLELTIRLIASLAVVIGLLLLIAKIGGRRFRGSNGAAIHVLHRQPLTRTSAISVVSIGGRVLVLGSTEQQINLIAEMDPDEFDLPEVERSELEPPAVEFKAELASVRELLVDDGAEPLRSAVRTGRRRASRADSALSGSILSAHTWRQALTAVTRRVS